MLMFRQGDVLLVAVPELPDGARAAAAARPPGPRRGRGDGPRPRHRDARRPRVPRRRRALRPRPLGGPADPRGARHDRPAAGDLPRRHPARVRAGADRVAGLAPGGRLMPAGQMPRPPADDAEARQRIAAYAAAARATALSTEPADRRRAERAIRDLYRQRGKSSPRILWVPSPVGGALTYAVASGDRNVIRNEAAKGDIGSGANAYWYSLADPFPLPHGAAARIRGRIHDRVPGDRPGWRSNLGLRTWESVPDVLRASLPDLCAQVATTPLSRMRRDDEAAWTLGQKLLGADADRFARMLGSEPFAVVLQSVVRRAFAEETTEPGRVRKAVQAMQPGQFDLESPFLAAIERVFGAPIWRRQPRRLELQNLLDAATRDRRLGRTVVGARRPGDRQRAPAPGGGRRSGPASLGDGAGARLRRRHRDPCLARRPRRAMGHRPSRADHRRRDRRRPRTPRSAA